MKKKIESYQGAAGGWGAVKSVANAVRKQMDIRQDVIAMFDMNKPEGFDCPGCAWPDPKHSASFDICENGAKAIAWEVTDKQVNASFFAENTVQSLLTWGDHELEAAGRLTQPLKYDAVSDCYKPLSWQQAFDEIGARLQSYSDPNQVEFYTSGRTSNEAAFLYQLFAREYGSNNFPDCSNMCHEPTSVGLAASIGVGKGTVLLEDFEKCDLVICIGHNPGTNHPRMLTSLRALVKRGAKMIAINPLQERGLERFTAPQNPFEMLTNSETQLASAYYNVRIGGDMALLKGMMRLLIERDDAASAAGRPSLLDDEFIQTHTVGFDELRRDVLNSEWKDIERISGLSQTQIAELADAYTAAERTIICYGMGITQHEHGTQNVQQLVNIDFSGHSENTFRIIDFSVPPTAYGKFMSTIFMQWVKNDVGEIFIRQFESFVSRFLGNGHTSCIFQESCKDNLVVESNGDIYECDHFVYPQYKIGNINKSELKTMNSVQLTAQKKRISAKCQQCAYKPICNGGCPKHRITKVNNETVSYFCEGYKILFSTMVPYMNAMVELAKNRVPLYHIMDVAKQMENN